MKTDLLDTTESARLVEELLGCREVVLTTHDGPDGDGIGSELALSRALASKGVRVHIINPAKSARRFRFMDDGSMVRVYEPGLAPIISGADLVLLVDTCEVRRTGPIAAAISKREGPVAAIDHHPPNSHSTPGILGSDFSSTGELMVHVIDRMGVPLDPEIASLLYAAIIFDTERFRFVRNDPEVFAVAARLVASGADAEGAAKSLFGSVPRDTVTLQGRVLGSATFEMDGELVWATVTQQTLRDLDVDADDVRGMVTLLAATEGVRIAVLFKVFRRGKVKISMRSPGNVPLNDVAESLGGGGHPFAAGADVDGGLDMAIERCLPMLREKLAGG